MIIVLVHINIYEFRYQLCAISMHVLSSIFELHYYSHVLRNKVSYLFFTIFFPFEATLYVLLYLSFLSFPNNDHTIYLLEKPGVKDGNF